ncbi:MaoC/PaaZ C-terminal domain-containing protein [Actinomyces sp. zg328]|uniref:MaoC/PaaZ C-terminal domain-containing protein n=1 Tax=Actinomyces sp. zg328 TaxID=2609287 RepID=UPI00135A9E41|nr:MaoC/PaaZ C-terminal domain-containing protein [Actinomyces sp. zg328]
MSAPSPTGPELVGLRYAQDVIERILTRSGVDDAEAASQQGAGAIAPALAALTLAREMIEPWEGLIHRRCRITPAPGGAAQPPPPRMRRTIRGGWEFIEVTAEVIVDDAARLSPLAGPSLLQVRHDLARRLSPARAGAPRSAEGAAGEGAATGRRLHLGGEDVAAWAGATGDDNPIHLHPGAARRAGLGTTGADVIAHGLLLAALSLGVAPPAPAAPVGPPAGPAGLAAPVGPAAPAGSAGLDLLFPAALAVGPAGAGLIVDDDGSGWSAVGARRVLRRRSAGPG